MENKLIKLLSMNRYKKVNLINSKSNVCRWDMGLIWGLILTLGVINYGCDENDIDEYYVKYVVNSSTIYLGKLNVTINTENNTKTTITIDTRTQWETVIGPVKKGFNATLEVNAASETYNHLRLYTELHVSKNGSPFALKKIDGSDTPRDSVSIGYKIDY
jgi:hypothetical protein